MRIVYPVMWASPRPDAAHAQSVQTAAALARAGHEVELLLPRGPGDPALSAADLRDRFGAEGDFTLRQLAGPAGTALPATVRWMRRVFADPGVRRADLLYSRVPAMLAAGQLCPVPFVSDHYRRWPQDLPLLRPLFRRTLRAPHCLGIVCHSRLAADAWRQAGVGAERLVVAHNGAEPALALSPAEARERLGLPATGAIALYTGRLSPRKGLDQLLALAALRPETLFLLLGSTGDGEIERQAGAHANVRALPWVGPADLKLHLAAADILLIPASSAPLRRGGHTVMPMKLFDYLAAGRPILAPVAADTAELLVDGVNALLVAPDRPPLAAAALDRLLADAALRSRLGAAARALAADLSWDRRAEIVSGFLARRMDEIGADQRSLNSIQVSPASVASTGAAQAPTPGGR